MNRASPEVVAELRVVGSVVLADVLRVEALGADRFVSRHPDGSLGRIYGGEVAAQGLLAAAGTVAGERLPHSLHVSFLGLGDPAEPVSYEVRRLRDSRLYATRWVCATQGERTIATLTASFQAPRPGLEHALRAADPSDLPPPDELPGRGELARAAFGAQLPPGLDVGWPIDIRYAGHAPWDAPADIARPAGNRLWLRAREPVRDDDLTHAAVLTYASDLTMFEPVIYPHNRSVPSVWEQLARGTMRGATLDHSVWFHRPVRADRWLLHEQVAPVAHDSRGFSQGRFFTSDGALVASVAQEVAILAGADVVRSAPDEGDAR